MTLIINLCSHWTSRLSHSASHLFKPSSNSNLSSSSNYHHHIHMAALSFLLFEPRSSSPFISTHNSFVTKASTSETNGRDIAANSSTSLNHELITSLSAKKDASEVLQALSDTFGMNGGVVNSSDCCSIIAAALDRNNSDLALSIFCAMRSSFDHGRIENGSTAVDRWKWSRPDVNTYTLLIRGLAALLRVSDAVKVIADVCRVAVSPGEEVPFGRIVKCPSCMIAIAVAQPQHGNQIVSCSKCRYKYELVSGDIVSIESEEIRIYV